MQPNVTADTRQAWQISIETSIAIIIALFSIGGNALVFIAFYRDRTLRTIPNAFIISLAVTDFLYGTTRLPIFIHTLLVGQWEFNQATCIFQGFQGYTLFAVTLHTLSAISITRCFLIVFPSRYKLIFTKEAVQKIIVAVWLLSLVFCSGPLFGWGAYKYDPLVLLCTFDHTSSKSYHTVTNTMVQVNAAIIIFCYILILKKVRDHRKRISQPRMRTANTATQIESQSDGQVGRIEGVRGPTTDHESPVRIGEEIHITRTLLIVVGLFGLCWLPSAVLGNLESESVQLPRWVRLITTMSIAMNSMTNPLVYGIRSPKFRKAFISALRFQ